MQTMSPSAASVRSARVLIVAASVAAVRDARRAIQADTGFHVSGSRQTEAAAGDIRSGTFDVVVVDHQFWCAEGMELRHAAHDTAPIAIVVVGAEDHGCPAEIDDRVAILHQSRFNDRCGLIARVTEAADHARALRRRETMTRWLEREANTDSLTGLHNRRAFDEALHEACKFEGERGVGLILMNVVGTGMVNHNYGEDAGDRMLQRAAAAIARSVRAADFAARLENDEFGVILRDADIDLCRRVARRIGQELERINAAADGGDVPVSVTFGAACGAGCGSDELHATAREQLRGQRQYFRTITPWRSGPDNGPSVA